MSCSYVNVKFDYNRVSSLWAIIQLNLEEYEIWRKSSFAPSLTSLQNKESLVRRAFSDIYNEDKDCILRKIVTGDETLVHQYAEETKEDTM